MGVVNDSLESPGRKVSTGSEEKNAEHNIYRTASSTRLGRAGVRVSWARLLECTWNNAQRRTFVWGSVGKSTQAHTYMHTHPHKSATSKAHAAEFPEPRTKHGEAEGNF